MPSLAGGGSGEDCGLSAAEVEGAVVVPRGIVVDRAMEVGVNILGAAGGLVAILAEAGPAVGEDSAPVTEG